MQRKFGDILAVLPFSSLDQHKSGRVRGKTWRWFAHGKHPAARDYFSLGEASPVCEALTGWIKKGYPLARDAGVSAGACSWRFWAKGSRKGELICGIMKDSADTVGRPFPFLIAGMGILNDWEPNWEMLGLACENVWMQMESISARHFKDLEQLLEELQKIKPPAVNWPALLAEKEAARDEYEAFKTGECKAKSGCGQSDNSFFVPLDGGDVLMKAHFWHRFYRKQAGTMPGIVFMGGSPWQSHLGFFGRALMTQDFVRLWSLCS